MTIQARRSEDINDQLLWITSQHKNDTKNARRE